MALPDPKLRIEAVFVDLIKSNADIVTPTVISASDRSVAAQAPYIMCWAERVTPKAEGHFVAQMRVVLVTNIDDTPHADRMAEAGRIFDHLLTGRVFETGDARILGWSPPTPQEVSTGQETGDSLAFMAGLQLDMPPV